MSSSMTTPVWLSDVARREVTRIRELTREANQLERDISGPGHWAGPFVASDARLRGVVRRQVGG